MLFPFSLEAGEEIPEEVDFAFFRPRVKRVEFLPFSEGDPEVPWIHPEFGHLVFVIQVTYHLISKEIESDPICVFPRQPAPELQAVESLCGIEIVGGNREVENIG